MTLNKLACSHHWICEASGIEVPAKCKKCGQTKTFKPYEGEEVERRWGREFTVKDLAGYEKPRNDVYY